MFANPEKLLEEYELEVDSITKGRGCYLCETAAGNKLLFPFQGNEKRAQKINQLLQYLKLQDESIEIEEIMETKTGTLVQMDEEQNGYILKNQIAGTLHTMLFGENCFQTEECRMVVGRIAQLHCLLQGQGICHSPKIQENYEKKVRQLKRVYNYTRMKNSKNAFENMYLSVFEDYYEQAKVALDYMSGLEETNLVTGIYHGNMNYHNILIQNGTVHFLNFEGCKEGWLVTDLVNYLRKLLEKTQYQFEFAKLLLEEYEKIRPLQEVEKKVIYGMFLFPEKFYKLSNHYDSTRKNWVTEREIHRLQQVVMDEDKRQEFLRNLFSFLHK